jgi:putative oxidoreductase
LSYLDRLQPLALLVMRLAVGGIMVVHGYHNVFGGLHQHAQWVADLGLPMWIGYLSSFIELIGSVLVIAGLFTRCGAFALCADLTVALLRVHRHAGIGDYLVSHYEVEFLLAAAALAFALIFFGAGPIGMDHVLRGGGSIRRS